MQSLKIIASTKQGKTFLFSQRDDSDLKLIINGEIQKNQEPKSHKNWYWCGRTLNGKEKVFEKELNLKSGIHYIEFLADRNPEVKEIKLSFKEKLSYPIFTLKDIKQYTFKGVKGDEDYNRFDNEILYAVNFWNKFFFSQDDSSSKPLDPNLIKAMIYVESRMGYEKNGFPDVMQVWDEANGTPQTIRGEKGYSANEYISDTRIGHMSYNYPKEWLPPEVKTSRESIFWGVRWLYYKAQSLKIKNGKLIFPYEREWKSWKDALSGYNPRVDYKEKVLKIYYEGIDQNGNILWEKNSNNKRGMIKIFFLFLFALLILFAGLFSYQYFKGRALEQKILNQKFLLKIELDEDTKIGVFQEISSSNIGLAIIDKKGEIKKWLPRADFSSLKADHFNWVKVGDFNKDDLKEIAFELQYIGPALIKPFYLYQKREDFKLLLSLSDAASETYFQDLNKDGILEIIHSFSLDGSSMVGRDLTQWKEIWAWNKKEYQKASNLFPEIYSDLIEFYEEILKNPLDIEAQLSYKKVIECLKEKAKLNQGGIFADGRECLAEKENEN